MGCARAAGYGEGMARDLGRSPRPPLYRHVVPVALIAGAAVVMLPRLWSHERGAALMEASHALARRDLALHRVMDGVARVAVAAAADDRSLPAALRATRTSMAQYDALLASAGGGGSWGAARAHIDALARAAAERVDRRLPPEPLVASLQALERQARTQSQAEQQRLAAVVAAETRGDLVQMALLAGGVLAAVGLAEWSRRREERTRLRMHELEGRLDELQAFAGRVAHDLRGPLTPIVVNSQMIEQSGVPDPVRRLAERIEGAAGRLAHMIDIMLTFARLEGTLRPRGRCELGRVVLDVVEDWRARAAGAGATLVTAFEDELWVACEPEIVGSAVQNLIDNALKYGLDGGDNRIELRVRRAGDEALLEVEDHGAGISPEALPHVFEPLFRGSDRGEGLGLGLAIVKRLVEARAGRILVRPSDGGGACFVVELPLAPSACLVAEDAPALGA